MNQDEIKGRIESEDIEISLLLQAIYLKYGYDFRNYSNAHMKRRILRRMSKEGLTRISEMQYKLLYDKEFFKALLSDFSINVTEMFRDLSTAEVDFMPKAAIKITEVDYILSLNKISDKLIELVGDINEK
ncbi:hypothetical protein [Clostridium magnum]|uniref:CheR methyltransferase, all-alpha domain n=1 Tax=Clostridium magnum DSM 2767 TaxID=1121326 RepID=A0A161X507_9CLOT|nr:hypothetical protein [Clostridium magnum]KZL89026.1 CheR methyltransferase, all-alpha domain [Clostridium magnum DSM 2767]SHI23200.1 CheB methylesterase [Clostridium magnum DSM 2767]